MPKMPTLFCKYPESARAELSLRPGGPITDPPRIGAQRRIADAQGGLALGFQFGPKVLQGLAQPLGPLQRH